MKLEYSPYEILYMTSSPVKQLVLTSDKEENMSEGAQKLVYCTFRLYIGLYPTAVEIIGSFQFFQCFWLFDGIHCSISLVCGHFL